jgi:hypothetical protein
MAVVLLVGCGSSASPQNVEPGAPDASIPVVPTPDGAIVDSSDGGQEPDAPTLGCTNLGGSGTAIPLEPDWQTPQLNGIGMAWTGGELVLAWSDARDGATQGTHIRTLRYQRRDATGVLSFGPVVNDDAPIDMYGAHGQSELGFDPASRTVLFVGDVDYNRYAELLDASGTPARTTVVLGNVCNPIMSRAQVYPTGTGFVVAQGEYSCSAADRQDARVDLVGLDGNRVGPGALSDTSYYHGMTWDPAGKRILFTAANSLIDVRWYLTSTGKFTAPATLFESDSWDSAVAYDGAHFGIAWGLFHADDHTGTAMTPTFDLWSIPDGAAPVQLNRTTLLTDGGLLQVPPRVIWTGDGWLVFSSVYPAYHSEGLPDRFDQFVTWVSSLAPDGTLRETFQLDTHPAYLVNAIWAGGRIAVTWVAADGAGHERHYLRYLSCS